MDTEMTVRVDPSIIDTHVRAAIAEALSKDPDALVRAVVDEAMSKKADSYGRETIFQKAVRDMIQDTAKHAFAEWLKTKSDVIQAAIEERLNKQGEGFLEDVADRLVKGMAEGFHVSVHLKEERF